MGQEGFPGDRSLHRRIRSWTWPAVTLGALIAAIALAGSIGWFYFHSSTGGNALKATVRHQIAVQSAPTVSPVPARACTQSDPVSPGQVDGLVQATAIGLDAPVVQGDGAAQLDVAVGHVSASSWPDQAGTVVLAAHDVSYFSGIDHLTAGATVRYVTPCRTYTYRVTSDEVVAAGSPVYNTSIQRLVMVTCYPLNALFLTPKRFLVTAQLVSITPGGQQAQVLSSGAGSLPVSLPASVIAEVAPRVTTTAPLGQLSLLGTPTHSWRSSIYPINATGSLLTLYFGALQVAMASPSLWAQVAPGVPVADVAALSGATVTAVPGPVTPTLTVQGAEVTGGSITTTVRLSGGRSPGTYTVHMTAHLVKGKLTVTGWQLQLA